MFEKVGVKSHAHGNMLWMCAFVLCFKVTISSDLNSIWTQVKFSHPKLWLIINLRSLCSRDLTSRWVFAFRPKPLQNYLDGFLTRLILGCQWCLAIWSELQLAENHETTRRFFQITQRLTNHIKTYEYFPSNTRQFDNIWRSFMIFPLGIYDRRNIFDAVLSTRASSLTLSNRLILNYFAVHKPRKFCSRHQWPLCRNNTHPLH